MPQDARPLWRTLVLVVPFLWILGACHTPPQAAGPDSRPARPSSGELERIGTPAGNDPVVCLRWMRYFQSLSEEEREQELLRMEEQEWGEDAAGSVESITALTYAERPGGVRRPTDYAATELVDAEWMVRDYFPDYPFLWIDGFPYAVSDQMMFPALGDVGHSILVTESKAFLEWALEYGVLRAVPLQPPYFDPILSVDRFLKGVRIKAYMRTCVDKESIRNNMTWMSWFLRRQAYNAVAPAISAIVIEELGKDPSAERIIRDDDWERILEICSDLDVRWDPERLEFRLMGRYSER